MKLTLRMPMALNVLGVSLFLAASPGLAKDNAETRGSGSHSTRARPGLISGTTLEVLGLLGTLAGAMATRASGDAADTAFNVMLASGGVFLAGNLISTASYTARHKSYRDAGLSPRPNIAVMSWLFTAATTGLYSASLVTNWRYADGLGSALFFSFTVLTEVLDFALFRSLWRMDLHKSDPSGAPTVALVPIALSTGANETARSPGLGIAGVF